MKRTLFSGMSLKTIISILLILISLVTLLLPWIEISIEMGGQAYRIDKLVEMLCTYEGMTQTQMDLELQAGIASLASDLSESGIILNTKTTLDIVQTVLSGRLSLLDLTKILFFANDLLSDLERALTIQSADLTGSQRLALATISDARPAVMVSMILFSALLIAAAATFILAIRSVRMGRRTSLIVYSSVQVLLFGIVAFVVYQANSNVHAVASTVIDSIESMLRMIGQYTSLDTMDLFHISPWAFIALICTVAALLINVVKANLKAVNVDVSSLGKWECPNCRSQVKITNVYCDVCGCKRPEKPRCECGAELKEGAAFCGKCGKRVEVVMDAPVYSNPAPVRHAEENPYYANPAPVSRPAARTCPRCGNPVYGSALYCDSCQQSRSKLHGSFGRPTDEDL